MSEAEISEILQWLRFSNITKLYDILESELDTPSKIIAYNYSDGINTARAISEKASVSHVTISNWWKFWYRSGIAIPVNVQGGGKRAKTLFNLEDYDINIPVNVSG